ncbi:MAG: DUF6985 domain-containing protein [Alphaproteobacteria bacterium]
MFGFLKAADFNDEQLGILQYVRGKWRGKINISDNNTVVVAMSGDRKQPHNQILEAARQLPAQYALLKPQIQQALYEHYEPYADESPVKIRNDASLWKDVRLVQATIEIQSGKLTTELAYEVTWDEEHTLGAVIVEGKFAELNGSILVA